MTFASFEAHPMESHPGWYGLICRTTSRTLGIIEQRDDGRWRTVAFISMDGELVDWPGDWHTHWQPCRIELAEARHIYWEDTGR